MNFAVNWFELIKTEDFSFNLDFSGEKPNLHGIWNSVGKLQTDYNWSCMNQPILATYAYTSCFCVGAMEIGTSDL